jgi:hypothetical protein
MTKRATGAFERKALDFYPTPPEAIEPLLPHLWRTNVHTFVEPCVGGHSLADYLEASGFDCVASGDLATGKDARDWKAADFAGVDASITNPPWTSDIMAEIMWIQSGVVPAWFLIYSDWLFTKQSAQLMRDRCTDIVPIGRLKWIPGSLSVGYDNCCWIRMTAGKQGPAVFWPMPGK